MNTSNSKIKVLFVCMGNICRSPSAEAVMKSYVEKAGLAEKIEIDSAGTISYHAGEPADSRMRRHAVNRDYMLTSISRQIKDSDFEKFDYIIGMDDDNMHNMKPFMPAGDFSGKLSLMTDFCSKENPGYVPDPYYGGHEGFEQVLDLLEDACDGLLTKIKNEHNLF